MKKVLVIVLFIVFSSLGYIGYLLYTHNTNINVSVGEKSDSITYGVLKSIKINEEDNTYYDQLYLRSDNSFFMSINSYNLEDIIVGTYFIDGNEITFNNKIRYSNNGCYYEEVGSFKGELLDYRIKVQYKDEVVEFTKDVGSDETITNINYYVINPIDKEKPKGLLNTWNNCSNKLTKSTN